MWIQACTYFWLIPTLTSCSVLLMKSGFEICIGWPWTHSIYSQPKTVKIPTYRIVSIAIWYFQEKKRRDLDCWYQFVSNCTINANDWLEVQFLNQYNTCIGVQNTHQVKIQRTLLQTSINPWYFIFNLICLNLWVLTNQSSIEYTWSYTCKEHIMFHKQA